MAVSPRIFLQIVALVLFGIAFIGQPAGRLNLIAGGLFCWLLSTMV